MSKFTPGPWELDKYGSVLTKQGEHVCFYGLSLSGGTEAKANGVLASAAPDLYEALVKVNNSAEWDYLESDIQEAVVSALAKADGK